MERRGFPLFFPSSALPPHGSHDASPKAISERTSYHQVRLAFHSLPQIIRWNCTTNRFGPPPVFLQTSPCPWQAHLISGPIHTTICALLTLGFPMTPSFWDLVCRINRLVGSFFNRHAVADITQRMIPAES